MRMFLTLMAFVLLGIPSGMRATAVYSADDIPTVDYCELINHPEKYDQKTVRVRAIYRYGYEWSEIYCPDCFDRNRRTWVESDNLTETCPKTKAIKQLRDSGYKGRTVRVVMVGKFHGSGGGYGHLNGYRFQLDVSCVEEAKTIFRDSPLPDGMSRKQLDQIGCQAPPSKESEGRQR
jgi:hypothetical protein